MGDNLTRGDRVAAITDLTGQTLAEVSSPIDGFVAALRLTGAVNPGEQIAVIFQLQPAARGV